MKFDFKELFDKNEILSTYNIYKACMYVPTEEKFEKKIDDFLQGGNAKMFACLYGQEIKGVVLISFLESGVVQINGIAVDLPMRRMGLGSYMIKSIMRIFEPSSIIAETDKDAVSFYKKCGFSIDEFVEKYGGEMVVRYTCELRNDK